MPEANWQQSGAKAALLIGWLEQKYGIKTRIMPQSVMGSVLRELDMHRARLLLSESLKGAATDFSAVNTDSPAWLSRYNRWGN